MTTRRGTAGRKRRQDVRELADPASSVGFTMLNRFRRADLARAALEARMKEKLEFTRRELMAEMKAAEKVDAAA